MTLRLSPNGVFVKTGMNRRTKANMNELKRVCIIIFANSNLYEMKLLQHENYDIVMEMTVKMHTI